MNTTLQDTRAAQATWDHTFSGRRREEISLTIGRRDGLWAKLNRALGTMRRRITDELSTTAHWQPAQ